jgi:pyruvate dehydrogenase E1 component beta subunit
MKYLEEVNKGMKLLCDQPNSIFVGQATEYRGTAITHQIRDFPADKKLEMPVAEDFQAGFCLGLAQAGYLPICVYPRFNFTILACNQIVNHIDKWHLMSLVEPPKIIIKSIVGSQRPLDPGHQHKANYVNAFREMCDFMRIIDITEPAHVWPAYKDAVACPESVMLVEYGDYYHEK